MEAAVHPPPLTAVNAAPPKTEVVIIGNPRPTPASPHPSQTQQLMDIVDTAAADIASLKTPLSKGRRRRIVSSQAISPGAKSMLLSPSFLAPDLSSCGKSPTVEFVARLSDQSVKDIMGGSDIGILKEIANTCDPSSVGEYLGDDPEVWEKVWVMKEEGL